MNRMLLVLLLAGHVTAKRLHLPAQPRPDRHVIAAAAAGVRQGVPLRAERGRDLPGRGAATCTHRPRAKPFKGG